MENEFALWSTTLYPTLDNDGWFVIAFEEDGEYYTTSDPEADFFAPVPHRYSSVYAVEAAIAVLKVWEAPVANDENCLSFDVLRATPEWAALLPHLAGAFIGNYTEENFNEATAMGMVGGVPGAYVHYRAMVDAGVKVEA